MHLRTHLEIALVADQHDRNACGRRLFVAVFGAQQSIVDRLQIVEGRGRGNVVHEEKGWRSGGEKRNTHHARANTRFRQNVNAKGIEVIHNSVAVLVILIGCIYECTYVFVCTLWQTRIQLQF